MIEDGRLPTGLQSRVVGLQLNRGVLMVLI